MAFATRMPDELWLRVSETPTYYQNSESIVSQSKLIDIIQTFSHLAGANWPSVAEKQKCLARIAGTSQLFRRCLRQHVWRQICLDENAFSQQLPKLLAVCDSNIYKKFYIYRLNESPSSKPFDTYTAFV